MFTRIILLLIICSLSVFFVLSPNASEVENITDEVKTEQATANKELFIQVCDAQLSFVNAPKIKSQILTLNKDVSLKLSQFLSTQHTRFGVNVATNVICQQLTGSQYTGSKQEWTQFIQQGISGLKKSGGKEMRLEIIGEKDKLFKQNVSNKEYKFFGKFNGSMQEVHNIAILDKAKNTVYTLSVSGNYKGRIAIKEEFTRLITTFKLNTEN